MTAYSSTKTGNWSDSTAWSPAAVPGNGDTVTINSGHTITVDVNTIVGTSPASGGAAAIVQNGPLIIAAGITFTVRGPVTLGNAAVTLNAGCILEMDASQATTPLSQTYAWTSSAFGRGSRMITCNGTSGSHVTIRSNAGGGNGYFYTGTNYNDSLWFAATYTDFQRIGDGTNSAIRFDPSTDTTLISLDHCTFDANCGTVEWQSSSPAAGGWSITHCAFNSTIANAWGSGLPKPLYLRSATRTTGTRVVSDCSFANTPIISANGNTYQRNYFANIWNLSSDIASKWALFDNNLIRFHDGTQASNGANYAGDVTNNFVLSDTRSAAALYSGTAASSINGTNNGTLTVSGTPWTSSAYASTGTLGYHVIITGGTGINQVRSIYANTNNTLSVLYPWDTLPDATSTFEIHSETTNPHLIVCQLSSFMTSATLSGNIFESTGTDSNGDCMLHMDEPSASYTLTSNIVLPNAARDNTGTLFTLGGTQTSQSYVVEHNTYFTGAQDAAVSEGGENAANQITSFRSNIAWCEPARTSIYAVTANPTPGPSQYGPYIVNDTTNGNSMPGSSTQDVIKAGFLDYNCSYGNRTGYAGKGYNVNCSVTPGAHDQDVNPTFVDSTRCFAKWAVTQGSTGTTLIQQISDGLSYIQATPSLVGSSLIPYITAGFAPTNSALHSTAHDGTDIGAVPYVASTPTISSWATSTAGTQITATLSQSGCTPATGTGGFTLHGTSATVSSWAIAGSTLTLTLSGTVAYGQTVTLDYSHAGASTPIASSGGNQVADITGASVTNNVPQPLAAGTASFVSSGPGGISVSATDASGGSSPYTYQWQRNSNGGAFANLSGATSRSLTDTTATTAGVLYGYKLVYTDSASATVTSNEVTAQVYSGGVLSSGGILLPRGFTGGFAA